MIPQLPGRTCPPQYCPLPNVAAGDEEAGDTSKVSQLAIM